MIQESVQHRLEKFITNWPSELRDEFKEIYRAEKNPNHTNDPTSKPELPIWMQIIDTLKDNLESNNSYEKKESMLNDIGWIQYCVLMTYRIKDDLFDSDLQNNSLVVVPDLFLFEAIRSLQKFYESSNPFWDWYLKVIESSIIHFLKIGQIQKNVYTNPVTLIELYEKLCSIFNFYIYIIYENSNINASKEELFLFNQKLLSADQIIDDIMDIEEDFNQGRYNYAVLQLLEYRKGDIDFNTISLKDIEFIIRDRGFDQIFNQIFENIEIAKKSIEVSNCGALLKFTENYLEEVSSLKKYLHTQRVRTIFENLINYQDSKV
jgi:hypothetical protein